MTSTLCVALDTTAEQYARLQALQAAFAKVCNALAPTVRETRIWNRVALHHLMYRALRERFPELGSQMVCNAIYSVSRTCRALFQHPQSPFNLSHFVDKPLPLLRFADTCPVYFDRHTLSAKAGQLSMYTLDGRMRFALALKPADEASFRDSKLREVVLSCRADGVYELRFKFTDALEQEGPPAQDSGAAELPEYVMVMEAS